MSNEEPVAPGSGSSWWPRSWRWHRPAASVSAADDPPLPSPPPMDPCLIIGALHGGSVTDAGYNQAMHDTVMAIKENIPCVEIIEAENVPEEAGATSTMENMIAQGAKMIIATAFNHQYPALELSQKYPTSIFEHAGGWEMGPNFANFYGEPAGRLVHDGRGGRGDHRVEQARLRGRLPARLDADLHQRLRAGRAVGQPRCGDHRGLHLRLG